MATYLYLCEPQNEEFEEEHSISIKLESCPKCKDAGRPDHMPKRLIYATFGTVQLEGQDLVDKIKADTVQLKKDMHKKESVYANLLGDDKYNKLQTKLDKQKR